MGLYAFLTDLRRQVSGILQPAHGGTGHAYGTEWSLTRGLNSTGSTIDRFNLVQLTGGTNTAKVSKVTATNSTHVLGVCVGYFDGQTLVEDDCPDGYEMAICIGGRVEVLIESAVTRDEFAYSAATDGTMQSSATAAAGAFGRVVESQNTSTGATTAAVILGLPGSGAGGGGGSAFGTPALTLSTSNAAGAALTAIRTDATIAAFDATAPVTQAIGDSAATGSAGTAARRDHKHGMPAFATPAVVLSSSAAAGSAATLIRSDSTIAAFDATAPVTQAMGDSAATGSAAFAARRDHKHGMPSSITQAQSHDSPDTDAATTSLHHTIGASGTQAAAGNHTHGAGGTSFIGVHAYRTTNKTITTATDTVVDFDAERYDSDGFHDNVTNNSRLTVPTGKDGKYHITFNCDWTAANGGVREARIRLNGTTYLGIQTGFAGNAGDSIRNSVSATVDLVATDYIEGLVRQTRGGNETLQASARYGPEITMYRIA